MLLPFFSDIGGLLSSFELGPWLHCCPSRCTLSRSSQQVSAKWNGLQSLSFVCPLITLEDSVRLVALIMINVIETTPEWSSL